MQILYNITKAEMHRVNDQNTTGTQSSSKVASYQVNPSKVNKRLINVQLVFAVQSLSYVRLCDPMDCSPPGFLCP